MSCGGKRREEVASGTRRPLLDKGWTLLEYLTHPDYKDRVTALREASADPVFSAFDAGDFDLLIEVIDAHLDEAPKSNR